LTNFETIKKRVARLKELEKMETEGKLKYLPKKETLKLREEREKLHKILCGIKDMNKFPDMVYIVDTPKERIAVLEARKLNIPVVAIVDSNGDPDEVDYCIPGNDDAVRAVGLITKVMADAVLEGKRLYNEEKAKEEERLSKEMEKEKALKLKDYQELTEDMFLKEGDKGQEKLRGKRVNHGD
ncbi:30S ribosomal protein S2, partial [bacterium]|nr:30S ribosomal protein S2 [bacterium]